MTRERLPLDPLLWPAMPRCEACGYLTEAPPKSAKPRPALGAFCRCRSPERCRGRATGAAAGLVKPACGPGGGDSQHQSPVEVVLTPTGSTTTDQERVET